MHREQKVVDESAEGGACLVALALLALLVGVLSGSSAQPFDFRWSTPTARAIC
jgi:hypothetical protein